MKKFWNTLCEKLKWIGNCIISSIKFAAKCVLGIISLVLFGSILVSGIHIWFLVRDLPNFSTFQDYNPYQTSYFLDKNNEIVGCIAYENGWRDIIGPQEVKNLPLAKIILASEDRRFYQRNFWAVDWKSMARALLVDIMHRKIKEGGSGIPQQLVKQLLPAEKRAKRNIDRKIQELILATELFWQFDKDKIFSLYLNEIYLDHQRHGIEAASRYYFNKRARDLNLSEMAVLAGMIKSPANNSPTKSDPDRAELARNISLAKALSAGAITEAEYQKAKEMPVVVSGEFEKSCNSFPFVADRAKEDMRALTGLLFDEGGKNPAWRGVRIYTTIEKKAQNFGQEGLRLALEKYKEKYGLKAVDADGAFIVIENNTGAIITMVGGNDYAKRKFNNVFGRRQTGSAIKPIVYVTKFEEELEEGKAYSGLLDRIVSNLHLSCRNQWNSKTKSWTYWNPRNFDDKKFSAPFYTRRFAIAESINRAAVWTAQVGKCQLDPRMPIMAKRLGIESPIDPHLPSALGASGISLMELARAFSVFPNKGVLRPTYMISKISDAYGKILYEKTSWEPQKNCGYQIQCGISEVLAGVMVEALRVVVKFGTGHALASLPQASAGKTGTTENFIDAWFMGFTPHITYGAWIGKPEDYSESLGNRATGGIIALPIAKYFLEKYYLDEEGAPFQEESPEYMKALVNPPSFEKELETLKNLDEDAEADSLDETDPAASTQNAPTHVEKQSLPLKPNSPKKLHAKKQNKKLKNHTTFKKP